MVTGAAGFIGAHVVDILLSRGIKVRGTTRSLSKGEKMLKARPEAAASLEFVLIDDFEKGTAGFVNAVNGIDGVIHVASVRRAPQCPSRVV